MAAWANQQKMNNRQIPDRACEDAAMIWISEDIRES